MGGNSSPSPRSALKRQSDPAISMQPMNSAAEAATIEDDAELPSVSAQISISSAAEPRKSVTSVEMVVCHVCGRTFGTASIEKHLQSCKQKWEAREATKPAAQRRPVPRAPLWSEGMTREEYNIAAIAAFKGDALQQCPHCGRSFTEEKLPIHMKGCKPAKVVHEKPTATKVDTGGVFDRLLSDAEAKKNKKLTEDAVEKRPSRKSSADSGVLGRLYEDAKVRQARLQSGEVDQDGDSVGRTKSGRVRTASSSIPENATQELSPKASQEVAKANTSNGNSHADVKKLPNEPSVAPVSNGEQSKTQMAATAKKSAGLTGYVGGCMPCLAPK